VLLSVAESEPLMELPVSCRLLVWLSLSLVEMLPLLSE
jgi:hypothetical protein